MIDSDLSSAGWMATVVILALAAASLALVISRRWHLLQRDPLRPQPFTPAVGFALYIAQFLAGALGATLAVQLFAVDIDPDARSFEQETWVRAGGYAGQLLVVALYAWLVWKAWRVEGAARRRMNIVRAAMCGAGALLLIWPIAQSLGGAIGLIDELLKGEKPPTIAHETLQQMLDRPIDGWFIATAALVLIAAPIAEEVFYRGIFQETLRRLSAPAWLAILATSALFAVMHITIAQPHAVASLFVLSIGFGWIYEKTERLTAPIVMHILFNAGNLVVAMALMR